MGWWCRKMSGSQHYSWYFIDKATGRCKLCEADGVEKVIKSSNSTNNTTHLVSAHQLSEKDDRVKTAKEAADAKAKQPTIDTAMFKSKAEADFLDYMLVFSVPLHRTESPLFRLVHPYAPAARATLRLRIISHSKKRFSEALSQRRGRSVTLALDAGTIWKKYLCIVALCYKMRPLVVSCANHEHMPASVIEDAVKATMAELAAAGLRPVGIVADNASNMQAALQRVPLLAQRCLAHSIQLCVNDAFLAEPFLSCWTAAKIILRDNGKTEPPLTRWSGKYLAMKEIIESTEMNISGVQPDDFTAMLPVVRALHPFFVATQQVQGNGTTMVTAAAVVHSLLRTDGRDAASKHLSIATKKRTGFLITDAVLVTCFFHPGVNRANTTKFIKDKIFAIVRTVFKEVSGEVVLGEWTRMRIEPPRAIDANVALKTEAYLTYWAKTAYENMACAVCRVVEGNPTEAECERAFSLVKFAFPRLRSSSEADLVTATVIGASAVASARRFDFDDDEPSEVHDAPDDREKVDVALTGEAAVQLMAMYEEVNAPVDEPAARRHRKESQLCGECKKDETHHPDEARWVKCTTSCGLWFAFCCVGIADEDYRLHGHAPTANVST
jgi:hypothetical protein